MTKKKLREGVLVKDLREKLGVNQKDLALMMKTISRSEICDFERGARQIGELNARRLSEFFKPYGFTGEWEQFLFSKKRQIKDLSPLRRKAVNDYDWIKQDHLRFTGIFEKNSKDDLYSRIGINRYKNGQKDKKDRERYEKSRERAKVS